MTRHWPVLQYTRRRLPDVAVEPELEYGVRQPDALELSPIEARWRRPSLDDQAIERTRRSEMGGEVAAEDRVVRDERRSHADSLAERSSNRMRASSPTVT